MSASCLGSCTHTISMLNALILLILLLSSLTFSVGNDVTDLFGDKPYNTNLDWESGVAAKDCTPAKKAAFKAPPTCPQPAQPVSRDVVAQLGVKFAPILYQHPLDPSWLTDPAHWLNEAVAYNTRSWEAIPGANVTIPPGVRVNGALSEYTSTQSFFASRLAVPTYNMTSHEVSFEVDNGTEVLRKAVVDPVVDGRLTGKVYYTAFRPFNESTGETIPHAWVFTYMYFYPWNGCANVVVATQVNSKKQGVEYIMCGDGAHEGDLEHVKVYVCEADLLAANPASVIKRTQYSQHGWLPELDCEAGECAFETDEAGAERLVVLAGLGSHANWKAETPLYLYTKVRLDFLLNMDGLYLGDRFVKGPVFYPNENNTRFLPFFSEMTTEQRNGELAWTGFPGVWGTTIEASGSRTITCLFKNLTVEGPCKDLNPAYYIVDVLLNPKSWEMEDMNWTAKESGNTVTGPLWNRVFSFNWEREREAPLYDSSFDGYCPLEAPIKNTDAGLADFPNLSLKMFLGAITGIVLASSVVAFAMVLPALLVRRDQAVLAELQDEEARRWAEKHHELSAAAGSPAAPMAAIDPANDGALAGPGVQMADRHVTTSSTAKASIHDAGGVAAMAAAAAASTSDAARGASGAALSPKLHLSSLNGESVGVNGLRSRSLAELMISHKAILRAFHASIMHPYFFIAWIFVGVALYSSGVVLGSLGINEVITALNLVVKLAIWQVVGKAIVAVFVLFGVVHLAIIIASIFVLPKAYKLCACGRKDPDAGLKSMRHSWPAHAVLAGLLVIEMSVSMLLFAFGLLMWVARYGVTEMCIAVIMEAFTSVVVLADLCLDLSSIGLSDELCLTEVSQICGIWADLNMEWLVYSSMLFLIAQSMFLVLATANYVAMRSGAAIITVMRHTETAASDRVSKMGRISGYIMGSSKRLGAALRFRSRGNAAAQSAMTVKSESAIGSSPESGLVAQGRMAMSEGDIVGNRVPAVPITGNPAPPDQAADMA